MNRDFVDMLSALSGADADYLVVGAHALAAHGHPRATGDLDIWVRPTGENARRVWAALVEFGAPLSELSVDDLQDEDVVFQIGVPPSRIDLLTSISGVEFGNAWEARLEVEIEGLVIPVLGRDALLANKRASGRPKDIADVAALEGSDPPSTT